MKISGISRTGRPLASSGKLRDTRMKRGDEIGRKAISFTSPDDFSEKSVSLSEEPASEGGRLIALGGLLPAGRILPAKR